MKRLKLLIPLLMFLLPAESGWAQKAGIKTNILYDAAANIAVGAEVRLAPQWSMDVSGTYNNWIFPEGRRWKNWSLQPEARFWLCEALSGHFVAIHVQGGQHNIGNLDNSVVFLGTDFSSISDERYQGWFAGAGLAYGYAWILGRHWNLEAELGLGYNYTVSDRYPCANCGTKIESGKVHHYWGPTKAAINLVYVF